MLSERRSKRSVTNRFKITMWQWAWFKTPSTPLSSPIFMELLCQREYEINFPISILPYIRILVFISVKYLVLVLG